MRTLKEILETTPDFKVGEKVFFLGTKKVEEISEIAETIEYKIIEFKNVAMNDNFNENSTRITFTIEEAKELGFDFPAENNDLKNALNRVEKLEYQCRLLSRMLNKTKVENVDLNKDLKIAKKLIKRYDKMFISFPFYMLYKEGGFSPTVKHDTLDQAQNEAKRILNAVGGYANIHILAPIISLDSSIIK